MGAPIRMIEKFEQEYLEYYWKNKMFQWKNYFENGNNDLSYIDVNIYKIVNKYNGLIIPSNRKSKLAHSLIQKDLIEKNPMVSNLRNHIDNLDNYTQNIPVNLDRSNYLIEISSKMKHDVLDLMNNRNYLANELGYSSYHDLILKTEEIDKNTLINLLNEYVSANLPIVKDLIDKYNIKWESWHSDLNKISIHVDQLNYIDIINNFANKLGFDLNHNNIQIIFKEHEISGAAYEVSPNDIRIVTAPIKSLENISTLFHELGHAISYYYNKEEGLYKIIPPCYDEAMAVVIEHIAPKILFDENIQQKIADIQLLEYTRCAISSLFEFELWEGPEHAEDLYVKHYSKLGFNISNPVIWAFDSFRSIDPVYIHNYVIGAVLAKNLITYFTQTYSNNYEKWGAWLINNIYFDGNKKVFQYGGKIAY